MKATRIRRATPFAFPWSQDLNHSSPRRSTSLLRYLLDPHHHRLVGDTLVYRQANPTSCTHILGLIPPVQIASFTDRKGERGGAILCGNSGNGGFYQSQSAFRRSHAFP